MTRTYATLDASGVVAQTPLTKLAGLSLTIVEGTYPHGLGVTPSVVIIVPRGAVFAYESTDADATNIYLTGAGTTTVDAYVAP